MSYYKIIDYLQKVDNRFKLIIQLSKRAKEIANGSPPQINTTCKKPALIALYEFMKKNKSISK